MAGHPSTVIFLTADAFGVLPPIARLTRDQALYHFISGYTAKLAGTEVGVQGADGDLLDLLRGALHAPPSGGLRRDAGRAARPARRAGLAGQHRLDRRPVRRRPAHEHPADPRHGPRGARRPARRASPPSPIRCSGSRYRCSVPGVPSEVLTPRATWADGDAYDAQARKLAAHVRGQLRALRGPGLAGGRGRRPAGRLSATLCYRPARIGTERPSAVVGSRPGIAAVRPWCAPTGPLAT